MKTSKQSLASLFDLLVNEMKDRLVEGDEQLVKVRSEDGDEIIRHRVKASAATLKTIATFLKDQDVGVVSENNEALQQVRDLLNNVSFASDEDDGDHTYN